MRRALIIGIDDYPRQPLRGCVNDATAMQDMLSFHDSGAPNFACKLLVPSPRPSITRAVVKESIRNLFAQEADVALFYFSGHGIENTLGGFLVTHDADEEGVAMQEIMTLAAQAEDRVREVVILLDCCHAGAAGNHLAMNNAALLRRGISILTASGPNEVAVQRHDGRSVFTALVVDALRGGAADVLGEVTIASIFAYVDQTLGAWDQRPHYKAHVSKLISLRTARPYVDKQLLRTLTKYFSKSAQMELPLDPCYEPTSSEAVEAYTAIFKDLQALRAARLVEPVGAEHLYYAAMERKSCRLTLLGQFYWAAVHAGRI